MKTIMKIAVWDFNGVIVDDAAAHHNAYNSILKLFNLPLLETLDEARRATTVPYSDGLYGCGVTPAQLRDHVIAIDTAYHAAYLDAPSAYQLRKGVRACLEDIRADGGMNVILSNTRRDVLNRQLTRTGIAGLFSHLSTSDDRSTTGLKMTKAERLNAYFRSLAEPVTQAFLIGDSTEEPAVAKAAGLHSIAVSGGWFERERLAQAGADHLIDCVSELPRVLRSIGFIRTRSRRPG